MHGLDHFVFLGVTGQSFLIYLNIVLSLNIAFIFANSADPYEMSHYMIFHRVFTVCRCIHIEVSSLQRVNPIIGLRITKTHS